MTLTRASAKALAGVVLRELPFYALWLSAGDWRAARNRRENLRASSDSSGYECLWSWTSELHAPKVMPVLGRLLIRRALTNHPIVFSDEPDVLNAGVPIVSFIIGHRGSGRTLQLLATLRTISAQVGTAVECIVVEQDVVPHVRERLPKWVRYVHTPPPSPDMPYCRSWSFNVGAQHASGEILVLHDNDMLVPRDYAVRILRCIRRGFDVVNLKRFIFYLTQDHTQLVLEEEGDLLGAAPEAIVQNLEAGGSIAITRSGFDRIGGMDESFVGWGGEDNEFWERAKTLATWPWGALPLVHLWHVGQPGKHDSQYNTALRYRSMAQVDTAERIRRLRSLPQGRMVGPTGWEMTAARPNESLGAAKRAS